MSRDYYNRRVGKDGERPRLELREVASQLAAAYRFVDQQGYLQRSFGYRCVDAGDVSGLHGTDICHTLYLDAGIKVTGHVPTFIEQAGDEAVGFTFVEFLHDHVAKPAEGAGSYHSFSNCGWHYDCRGDRFDEAAARGGWRGKVNAFLKFYGDGYELSPAGEIMMLAPDGLTRLVEAKVTTQASDTDQAKVANAVHTFRLGRSTREQRKQAVRDLVDVLEFHRQAVKTHLLSKDESDLFTIANNFALRHHRADQKDDYDDAWLNWLFYIYLATVHLVLGLVHGEPASEEVSSDIPF